MVCYPNKNKSKCSPRDNAFNTQWVPGEFPLVPEFSVFQTLFCDVHIQARTCTHVYAPHGGQRTAGRTRLSPSSMWDLQVALRLSGKLLCPLTHLTSPLIFQFCIICAPFTPEHTTALYTYTFPVPFPFRLCQAVFPGLTLLPPKVGVLFYIQVLSYTFCVSKSL